MEKISFDNGIRQFQVNGEGILRFQPADPNLYSRFSQAGEKIRKLEMELLKESTGDSLDLLTRADRQIKELLTWAFGADNDFDEIFQGVNVLAVAENGQQVITNFLEALEPVITAGVKSYVNQQVEAARQKAQARREGQR